MGTAPATIDADYPVTDGRGLLSRSWYEGIAIITPREFLDGLES